MKNIATTIAYASAWIATAIAVIFAIKYTGSAWCLWAFLLVLKLVLILVRVMKMMTAQKNKPLFHMEIRRIKEWMEI